MSHRVRTELNFHSKDGDFAAMGSNCLTLSGGNRKTL